MNDAECTHVHIARTRTLRPAVLAASALAVLLSACAHMQAPPGGHVDQTPPQIVSIDPGDGATNVTSKSVSITFDKVVSEHPSGVPDLKSLAILSPRQGDVNVTWHRHTIRVRPDKGWRANTAYSLRLLAGTADLWGNIRKTDTTIFFSTGATIPSTSVRGVLFDWEAGAAAINSAIQLYQDSDSTFMYVAQTDSVGEFVIPVVPGGTYRIRGIMDANRNGAIDPNEPFDTATVVVPQSTPIELLAITRDTAAPVLGSTVANDSVTLRVTFSYFTDPLSLPAASQFTLVAPDSSRIAVLEVASEDEAARRSAASNDTTQASADTTATDTTANTAPAERKPSKPSPYRTLILKVATPLAAKTQYTIHATNIRGLNGVVHSSNMQFTTPAPPSPPTAKPAADTTSGAPSAK